MARARTQEEGGGGAGGGGLLMATESFSVGVTVVNVGDLLDAGDPIVKGREELFAPAGDRLRFASGESEQHLAGDERIAQLEAENQEALERSMQDASAERERLEAEAAAAA